jgi:hypothetical protein
MFIDVNRACAHQVRPPPPLRDGAGAHAIHLLVVRGGGHENAPRLVQEHGAHWNLIAARTARTVRRR